MPVHLEMQELTASRRMNENDLVSEINRRLADLNNYTTQFLTSLQNDLAELRCDGIKTSFATVGNSITLWFLCDNAYAVLTIWQLAFSGRLREIVERLLYNVCMEEVIRVLLRISFRELKLSQMSAFSKYIDL